MGNSNATCASMCTRSQEDLAYLSEGAPPYRVPVVGEHPLHLKRFQVNEVIPELDEEQSMSDRFEYNDRCQSRDFSSLTQAMTDLSDQKSQAKEGEARHSSTLEYDRDLLKLNHHTNVPKSRQAKKKQHTSLGEIEQDISTFQELLEAIGTVTDLLMYIQDTSGKFKVGEARYKISADLLVQMTLNPVPALDVLKDRTEKHKELSKTAFYEYFMHDSQFDEQGGAPHQPSHPRVSKRKQELSTFCKKQRMSKVKLSSRQISATSSVLNGEIGKAAGAPFLFEEGKMQ